MLKKGVLAWAETILRGRWPSNYSKMSDIRRTDDPSLSKIRTTSLLLVLRR